MSESIGELMDELGLRLELHRVLSDPKCSLKDAHKIEDQIEDLRRSPAQNASEQCAVCRAMTKPYGDA